MDEPLPVNAGAYRSAPGDWPNEDVEGVCVDPAAARIVRRWTASDFVALVEQHADEDGDLDAIP